jgi:hypothetical protein
MDHVPEGMTELEYKLAPLREWQKLIGNSGTRTNMMSLFLARSQNVKIRAIGLYRGSHCVNGQHDPD